MRRAKRYCAGFLLSSLFCIFAVRAQTVDPEFRKAQQERIKAIRTSDVKLYDQYTTDNFSVMGPTGIVVTKAEQDARVASGKANPPGGFEPHDQKMDVYPNTIILHFVMGVPGKETRSTEVWVKEGGVWRCAAAIASPVPASQ